MIGSFGRRFIGQESLDARRNAEGLRVGIGLEVGLMQ